MSLFTAFRKEWMENVRNYRLLVVVVVLLFFGITSPILTKYTPELMQLVPTGGMKIEIPPQTVVDAITQYVKNMGQFGVFLGVLLTMGAVAQEKEKGTAAMMLAKPLPRGAFLGAKFLGLAALFAVGLAAAMLAAYYYTLLLFEAMDIPHWLLLNLLIFVYVLVIIAITLFCSTLTRSQATAVGISAGFLVVAWLASAVLGVGKYLPGELITWGVRLMAGNTTSSWVALAVSLGLIVLAFVAAWLVFRRQEL